MDPRGTVKVWRPSDLKQFEFRPGPLRLGRNEIVLGVADYFGGWGFICRLEDTAGIRLD